MDALDHAIRFQKQKPAFFRRGHDCAIVARPGNDVRPGFEPRHQLRDQPVLAQLAASFIARPG